MRLKTFAMAAVILLLVYPRQTPAKMDSFLKGTFCALGLTTIIGVAALTTIPTEAERIQELHEAVGIHAPFEPGVGVEQSSEVPEALSDTLKKGQWKTFVQFMSPQLQAAVRFPDFEVYKVDANNATNLATEEGDDRLTVTLEKDDKALRVFVFEKRDGRYVLVGVFRPSSDDDGTPSDLELMKQVTDPGGTGSNFFR